MRFATAHPDLYRVDDGVARLHIRDGRIFHSSPAVPGLAVGCASDCDNMRPMAAED
jgi:hypothetical protein